MNFQHKLILIIVIPIELADFTNFFFTVVNFDVIIYLHSPRLMTKVIEKENILPFNYQKKIFCS